MCKCVIRLHIIMLCITARNTHICTAHIYIWCASKSHVSRWRPGRNEGEWMEINFSANLVAANAPVKVFPRVSCTSQPQMKLELHAVISFSSASSRQQPSCPEGAKKYRDQARLTKFPTRLYHFHSIRFIHNILENQ